MGSRQELIARASVEALAGLQVPHARVRRSGHVEAIESINLVPGDVVLLEAGDVVPADGRVVVSATLELQEAALTGESAPVAKDRATLPAGETALGDRTNLVFQNTQVTRGTAGFVVTDTGQATQMGRIADMVTATKRVRSPLQRELDGLTKIFGLLAWTAVAIIAIVGIARGQDHETLVLLCISTAISAIPVGLPTFVQTMLSSGAQHLAASKAVVKSLTDVETLGGTTVINSDKTGTLTMNAMTATTMLADGTWFSIEGGGYKKSGAILGVAGGPVPDFGRLALGLTLCCDATVGDDESVIGDPTEAAFVVLAAKMGVGAEETREALPRRAEVPFDSEYKFMATFHDRPDWMTAGVLSGPHFMTVKGAPDIVLQRCGYALWHGKQVPIADAREELLAANQQMSEQGLRVLAFAVREVDDTTMAAADTDPMPAVTDLVLIALVGIIDPLRAEAKQAVRVALDAGIDVRMITGDHTITARAIADQLQLGPGVITGTELQALSDDQVIEQLPQLHVFGRVAPEDKVRLARLMQQAGEVVAMTGDAVNDAAALKQADIGVAMGSGSEVTQQAAKIVLTDDNFATLVRAVDLGRDIYRRITSYVKLQLTVLSAVLQLMLLATIFNINGGVALFPMQLLFCKFFVVVTVVIGFIADVPDPSVMQRPPRAPGTRIVTGPQVVRWLISGFIIAALALAVLEWGPGEPSTKNPSVPMTMAFAIVALSAVNLGVVMRREREAAWSSPIFPYFGWIMLGWVLTWAGVELNMLQRLLDTVSLTGAQWLTVIGLSIVSPAVVGIDKAIQMKRQSRQPQLVESVPSGA
jgi:Ca2+-transporting ATPase